MPLSVTLPLPPSTNNLYRTVTSKGKTFRVKSTEYKKWEREAGVGDWPGPYPHGTKWSLYIDLGQMPYTRDIDNCAKAIIDLLAEKTRLADRRLDFLAIFRSGVDLGGKCVARYFTEGEEGEEIGEV